MVEKISPEELESKQESAEEYTLVDTRPEDSYEAWHVEGAENFPFDPDAELDEEGLETFEETVGDRDPVVTICAKGISSDNFARELEANSDHEVETVDDGMEGWSQVYDRVPIETTTEHLAIVQIQRRAKGCLGYVVGDVDAGEGVVVDATRNTEEFAEAAREAGLEVTHVLDTHVHADHISGGRELADELGVPYHLGARAEERDVDYEFEPLDRNEVIEVGDVDVKALFAPGHTTEMVNYLVGDEAVLTGDTLFVDSVGRTELEFGEGDAEDGARMLHETLHRTLLAEPDSATVLPGHVTVRADGTFADATRGAPVSSSVGVERTGLDLLGLDEEAFVETMVEDLPEKPPNYEEVIAINRGVEAVEDEEEAIELEMGPNNCSA